MITENNCNKYIKIISKSYIQKNYPEEIDIFETIWEKDKEIYTSKRKFIYDEIEKTDLSGFPPPIEMTSMYVSNFIIAIIANLAWYYMAKKLSDKDKKSFKEDKKLIDDKMRNKIIKKFRSKEFNQKKIEDIIDFFEKELKKLEKKF